MLCHRRLFKATLLPRMRGVNVLPFSSEREKYEEALTQQTKRSTKLIPTMWNLKQIKDKLDGGEINLLPKYQRGFVWKSPEASRLVLTLLGGRFVPSVVVHEKDDGTYDVVDGKQRLTSLLSFMYGANAKKKPP